MRAGEGTIKITERLKRAFVVLDLKAVSKVEVLAELTAVFTGGEDKSRTDAMLHVLLEREKLGSTGIGDGIAIPHGKVAGLDEIVVAFGRSRGGVDFDSLDGRPAHLFFLLMAPDHSAGVHLKVLAKISRMLKDKAFRKRLLDARIHEDLFLAISEKDEEC